MKIFKRIKKAVIVAGITIMALILNLIGMPNCVSAAELGTSATLVKEGDCGQLLKYNGITVVTTYVAHKDGNNLYPAYCLNANLLGVGENGSYDVSTNELVSDVGLWRRIINGYPYKTLSELGCNTKEEAFTATKHAVYCYVHGNNPDNYSAIGEAGQRTLKAMKKIIKNAEKSTETKMQTSLTINKNKSAWKEDELDKNYASKTYEVEANSDYKNYSLTISAEGAVKLPEGIKITDVNNNEKSTFNKGEKFKVLIPIKNLKNSGEFVLHVKSELNTKPVLYGKAPSSNLQDYAITTLKYENAESTCKDSYVENKTQIDVYKQEKNTKKPLEGVCFRLLNKDKEVVYTDLKTDKDGKVSITGIMPGKYYLQETKTLEGYVRYDEDIEIDVDLNEKFKVTVNNSKETKIEVEKTEKELTVSKELEKKEIKEEKIEEEKNEKVTEVSEVKNIKKLPVTGM